MAFVERLAWGSFLAFTGGWSGFTYLWVRTLLGFSNVAFVERLAWDSFVAFTGGVALSLG